MGQSVLGRRAWSKCEGSLAPSTVMSPRCTVRSADDCDLHGSESRTGRRGAATVGLASGSAPCTPWGQGLAPACRASPRSLRLLARLAATNSGEGRLRQYRRPGRRPGWSRYLLLDEVIGGLRQPDRRGQRALSGEPGDPAQLGSDIAGDAHRGDQRVEHDTPFWTCGRLAARLRHRLPSLRDRGAIVRSGAALVKRLTT